MAVDYVSVDVMVKGTSGLLVPLGIENLIADQATVIMCYNIIAIALMMFIAGFSSQRSEAAACVTVPIFGFIFALFGWFRAPNPADQLSLMATMGVMFLLGCFIYANDQNKSQYGSGYVGSKITLIVIFMAVFGASYSVVSDFPIFPNQGGMVIPDPGTCVAGLPCAASNIDFETTSGMFNDNSGLGSDIVSSAMGLPGLILSMISFIIKILLGIFAFPALMGGIAEGVMPGITGTAQYIGVVALLEIAWLIALFFGILGLARGTTSEV